jgi:hypothetical protein
VYGRSDDDAIVGLGTQSPEYPCRIDDVDGATPRSQVFGQYLRNLPGVAIGRTVDDQDVCHGTKVDAAF